MIPLHRLPIVRSIFGGLAVCFSALIFWVILFTINTLVYPNIPWSVLVTAVYLYFWNRYVKGDSTKSGSARLRAECYRAVNDDYSVRVIVAAVLASLGILILMVCAYKFLKLPVQEAPMKNISTLAGVIYFAMSAVVAGLCEEVGFRGYMQQPLEKRYGITKALVITTTVFTFVHLGNSDNWPLIPFYVASGLNFGLMSWLTRNLKLAIALHTATNFLSYLILWQFSSAFTNPVYRHIFLGLFVLGSVSCLIPILWLYPKAIESARQQE